jgi:hypothetical protein
MSSRVGRQADERHDGWLISNFRFHISRRIGRSFLEFGIWDLELAISRQIDRIGKLPLDKQSLSL